MPSEPICSLSGDINSFQSCKVFFEKVEMIIDEDYLTEESLHFIFGIEGVINPEKGL